MTEKKKLNPFDKLIFISYLLIQDRINEAKEIFKTIDPKPFEAQGDILLKLQFNYMQAYFDFYDSQTGYKLAKAISKQYVDYPVITWRMKFQEILDQLKEFEGQEEELTGEQQEKKAEEEKKDQKKSVSFELEGKDIIIKYDNVSQVTIKYYLIDPEVAFSKSPFLSEKSTANDTFSFVKEVKSVIVNLDPNLKSVTKQIEPEFIKKNVMVEVNAVFVHYFQTYFASDFKVTIYENYGELKVSDNDGKPLSQVYVKVYAKYNGNEISLYKDGYTDI